MYLMAEKQICISVLLICCAILACRALTSLSVNEVLPFPLPKIGNALNFRETFGFCCFCCVSWTVSQLYAEYLWSCLASVCGRLDLKFRSSQGWLSISNQLKIISQRILYLKDFNALMYSDSSCT